MNYKMLLENNMKRLIKIDNELYTSNGEYNKEYRSADFTTKVNAQHLIEIIRMDVRIPSVSQFSIHITDECIIKHFEDNRIKLNADFYSAIIDNTVYTIEIPEFNEFDDSFDYTDKQLYYVKQHNYFHIVQVVFYKLKAISI